MSFDVLQDKIRAMKNPTVVGLDPKPEYVPPQMRKECYDQYGETLEGAAEAIYRFNCGLMDALCDIVPAVKPQAGAHHPLCPGKGLFRHCGYQAGRYRFHRPGLQRRLAGKDEGGLCRADRV